MKLIIAGGRNYHLTPDDIRRLDWTFRDSKLDEVVTGGATGADRDGKAWAEARGKKTRVFEANWEKNGKFAGPLRNREMARYADAVVLFPGGKGTESMYKEAKRLGLNIYDWRLVAWAMNGDEI